MTKNFLNSLKNELDSDVLVIFLMSENFYSSPICLCEMGATWVKANQHIPVLIPPFDYKDIEGVIPLTQRFKINEHLKLTLFKQKLEQHFDIKPINSATWERKRDKILKKIKTILDKEIEKAEALYTQITKL